MTTSVSVLLVDDEPFAGKMMTLHLQKAGIEVVAVESGLEALAEMDRRPFDVLLTDLVMPEMSGIELVRAVRQRPDGGEIPILVLSGMDKPATIVEAIEAGADDFVPKMKEHALVVAKVRFVSRAMKGARQEREQSPSGDALWSWHLAKKTIQYSQRWKAHLGYAPEEIGSAPEEWFDRIHPDDRERVLDALAAHRQRRTPWFEADFLMRHKDGNWLAAHAFGVALFGKDGQCTRMVGSLSIRNRLARGAVSDHIPISR